MLKSEADRLRVVIICSPHREYYHAANLAAHNIITVADSEKALYQHGTLKKILKEFGVTAIDVPELPNHPNSVFTRDTAVCTPEGFIELRPGLPSREAEGRWMAAILRHYGEPCAGRITPPGTADGGDIVLCDRIAFIGKTQRTNREGCRQLSTYLKKMGYQVRGIPLPETVLHLDKVLMPIDPERLLVCTDIVPDDDLKGFEITRIAFTESSTANVICLGDGELVVGNTNSAVLQCLSEEPLKIHCLDISEFTKGAGGPNCLIMPVARYPS